MEPYYADATVTIHHGDCLDVLAELPDASVDAVVTDPPYGLEFMGKEWDSFKTYAGGNPNMKPQGTSIAAAEDGDWQPGRAYGSRQKNPRCRRCGKLMRGNGACKCPEPQPDTRTAEGANQYQFWCEEWATECLRVLKPGGHMLAFGGTRTSHRLACAVEDAGFEIRDSIAWLYGSGFPKSLDVSKAIDKAANAAPLWDTIRAHIREWRDKAGMTNTDLNAALGLKTSGSGMASHWTSDRERQTAIPSKAMWLRLKVILAWPDCDLDATYDAVKDGADRPVIGARATGRLAVAPGQGADRSTRDLDITAPATDAARTWQGWGTALKPAHEPIVVARKPLEGTVAANVLAHGTGALNVDGCRIDATDKAKFPVGYSKGMGQATYSQDDYTRAMGRDEPDPNPAGRWPANVVLDESQAAALDAQSGEVGGSGGTFQAVREVLDPGGTLDAPQTPSDYGKADGASRFMYTAKAASSERIKLDGTAHPTVKPLALMRWLVRLVTPPGGTVLEPFAGSGTTVEACILEGFRCIAIEREPDYLPLIRQRIHRRRDPVEAVRGSGEDGGLFDLFTEEPA